MDTYIYPKIVHVCILKIIIVVKIMKQEINSIYSKIIFLTFNLIFKLITCESCITESYDVNWMNELCNSNICCNNCFGIVKKNIKKVGFMELVLNLKRNETLKIHAQVKCANPESETWSWPIESDFI